jgi:ribose transport system substrate-binding protein
VLLAPQIREAKKAGIKIIAANERAEGIPALNPDVTAVTSFKYRDAGKLMADWIIQDSHGTAKILSINTPEVTNTKDIKAGIESELKSKCPGCTLIETNTTLAQYQQVGTFARTQLTRNPGVTYLLPYFDSMISAGIGGALKAAGLTGKVKLVSWNATPGVLQLFKSNQLDADVGAPNVWMGWAQMDQALRLLVGLPPTKDTAVPVRLWTKSDIGQIDLAGDEVEWYGTSFVNKYKKLWGLA